MIPWEESLDRLEREETWYHLCPRSAHRTVLHDILHLAVHSLPLMSLLMQGRQSRTDAEVAHLMRTANELSMILGGLRLLLVAVRDVCLSVATGVGLKLNEDFTAAVDVHGDPILIAKPEVQRIFYAALPTQRHSILRFYLQEPMA